MKKLMLLFAVAMAAVSMQAQEVQVVNPSEITSIERGENKDFYYLHAGQQTTRMEKEAYLRFIENNSPEAWASYQKGTKLWKAGWGLFGAGLGVGIVGIVMCGAGVADIAMNDGVVNQGNIGLTNAGVGVAVVGDLMIMGSIPCLVVGSIKRNNTHEVYNKTRHLTSPLTFQLQTSQNGVGIAMTF
ncbi:MAG: hypothetical protein ACI30J_02305 [Paludibacteraceae bacterium]